MDNNFLVIENISKSFGDNKVLENINLNISKSEFFGLLGSSGSGKTTLLRILGGFEKPDTGRVILDGTDITNLEPFERPLNYMFQSYALFPHLNVFNNLAFGIKENFTQKEIEINVRDIAKLLSIEHLLNRRIKQLSGGEQQRVNLAVALASPYPLLLLDEPTASLDPNNRKIVGQLISEALQQDCAVLAILHDEKSVATLATQTFDLTPFTPRN